MLKIGLTGGIGSGKSTVAHFFEKLDIDVIDTDKFARDLTQTFQPAYFEIVKRFGNQIVTKEGHLNRTILREMIFRNSEDRKWLELLLHPLIRQKTEEAIAISSSPYVIIVVPLLVEKKMMPLYDRILVVDSPMAKQLERTTKRDSTQEALILEIMNTQASREERLAAATDIIVNDKDLDHLQKEVLHMHNFFLTLADTL